MTLENVLEKMQFPLYKATGGLSFPTKAKLSVTFLEITVLLYNFTNVAMAMY